MITLKDLEGNFNTIYVSVPSENMLFRISEGDGSNLLPEDKEEGLVDYVNYDSYIMDAWELEEYDGGMVMYEELVQEKFKCLAECIPDVLEQQGIDGNAPYIIVNDPTNFDE